MPTNHTKRTPVRKVSKGDKKKHFKMLAILLIIEHFSYCEVRNGKINF